ncbi:MAG: ABC transporter substrate-binding protein [Thermodesulfobacteriota bacterium]
MWIRLGFKGRHPFLVVITMAWLVSVPVLSFSAPLKVVLACGVQSRPVLEFVQNQGYFTGQGLDVTLNSYVMGKEGVERMFAGESDFAISATGPVAHLAMDRQDLRVVASLYHHSNISQIVALRNRGISGPKDLRGKRIGVSQNTMPHFFADMLLSKNGIPSSEVTWVFRDGEALFDLLTSDGADAIASVSYPAIVLARKLGSDKAVAFGDAGLAFNNMLLVSKQETLARRPEAADRLLRALLQAEEYLAAHPDKLPRLLFPDQKINDLDARLMASDYHFKIGLPVVLLRAMEEFSRWSMENGFSKPKANTNFSELIDAAPLRRVAPETVAIGK